MAEYTLSTTALVSSGSKPSTTLGTWKDEGGVGGTVTKISDSSDSTYLRKDTSWATNQLVTSHTSNGSELSPIAAGTEVPIALKARARVKRSSTVCTYTLAVANNVATGRLSAPSTISPTTSAAWYESGWITNFADGNNVYTEYTAGSSNRDFVTIFGDAQAAADAGYLYEMQMLLQTATVPSVTVSTPSATSTSPTIEWTYSDTDAVAQAKYRLLVYTSTQYSDPSFVAGTSTAAYDSGTLSGTSASIASVGPLTDGTTYKAYVAVAKAVSGYPGGYLWSSYAASSAWTIAASPPAAPTLSAAWQTGSQSVKCDITAYRNLMRIYNSTFELDGGIWTTVSNCTATRSSTVASNGTYSMRLSATGAGDVTASNDELTAVTVGTSYTAMAKIRAGASARTCKVSIIWYNSVGAVLSTSDGSTATSSTSAWTDYTCTATAPASAAYAAPKVTIASAGGAAELHYVDQADLHVGSGTTWTPGGALAFTVQIQRSEDGGTTWTTIQGAADADILADPHTVSIYDYLVTRGISAKYRARATLTDALGVTQTSAWSSTASVSTTNDSTWWLKAVDDHTLNGGSINVLAQLDESTAADVGVFRPLDASVAVVVSGAVGGTDGSYKIHAPTETVWTSTLRALYRYTGTLLVQDPLGRQKYVRWVDRSGAQSYSGGNARRELTLGYVEVDGPAEPTAAEVPSPDLTLIYDDDLYGYFDANTFG